MNKGYGRVKAARAIITRLWQIQTMNVKKGWLRHSGRTCDGEKLKKPMSRCRRVKLINLGHADALQIHLIKYNNLKIGL
jgi:hypothetical protein